MTHRPWDILELAEGDVFKRGLRSVDGTFPVAVKKKSRKSGQRVVRKVPTLAEQTSALFRQSSRWTREVIRELARLGADIASITDTHVYLINVGRNKMTITIRHTGEFPVEIARVTFGRESWTARQAALWLRKRATR